MSSKKAKPELTWIGMPCKYALIPHDIIAENMTLEGFVK